MTAVLLAFAVAAPPQAPPQAPPVAAAKAKAACPCGCDCAGCGCSKGAKSVAAPVSPDALAVPAKMPEPRNFRIGSGPWITESEMRRQLGAPVGYIVPNPPVLPAGVPTLTGGCANGQCPAPATSYRRFR